MRRPPTEAGGLLDATLLADGQADGAQRRGGGVTQRAHFIADGARARLALVAPAAGDVQRDVLHADGAVTALDGHAVALSLALATEAEGFTDGLLVGDAQAV